jgi:hypothetical protein
MSRSSQLTRISFATVPGCSDTEQLALSGIQDLRGYIPYRPSRLEQIDLSHQVRSNWQTQEFQLTLYCISAAEGRQAVAGSCMLVLRAGMEININVFTRDYQPARL